jgi:hypothetical protein
MTDKGKLTRDTLVHVSMKIPVDCEPIRTPESELLPGTARNFSHHTGENRYPAFLSR